MIRANPFRSCLFLFVILSGADLVMTTCLLHHSTGICYEANPLAGWFLDRFDWGGMALFKIVTVIATICLLSALAHRRPRAARALLTFACALLIVVVGYSTALATGLASSTTQKDVKRLRDLKGENKELDATLRPMQKYFELERELYLDAQTGRKSLQQVAKEFLASQIAWRPQWLRQHQMLSDPAIAEQKIAKSVLTELMHPEWGLSAASLARLKCEYQFHFGHHYDSSMTAMAR